MIRWHALRENSGGSSKGFESPQHPRCLGLVPRVQKHTDIVHSHLLFHLPAEYRFGRKLDELTVFVERLVALHGGGIWSEYAVKKSGAIPTASICSKAVVPKYGDYFASRRNGARRKASFTASGAVSARTSAPQLAFVH